MRYIIKKHYEDEFGIWLSRRLPVGWTIGRNNALRLTMEEAHMVSGWLLGLGISHDLIQTND